MASRGRPDRVFLNIPFDAAYEPVMVGLVAAIVQMGKWPTTVLDIGDTSIPRIDRLLDQLQSCAFSLHDLSRVERSGRGPKAVPRFNMPFELGLAVAIARSGREMRTPHRFALLESEPYRLQRSLSDMNGFDPKIHHGTREGAVRCVLDTFSNTSLTHSRQAIRLAARLARAASRLKHEHGVSHLFGRVALNELIAAAVVLRG